VRKKRLNISVLLLVQNHENAEKKCVFTKSLEAGYLFLKEGQQVGKVLCSICKSQFSTEHGGRSDILQHIKKKKRKHAIAAETKSCSKKVTSYVIVTVDIG
jgi:hypothetical protein